MGGSPSRFRRRDITPTSSEWPLNAVTNMVCLVSTYQRLRMIGMQAQILTDINASSGGGRARREAADAVADRD